jgi:hypothetical protein
LKNKQDIKEMDYSRKRQKGISVTKGPFFFSPLKRNYRSLRQNYTPVQKHGSPKKTKLLKKNTKVPSSLHIDLRNRKSIDHRSRTPNEPSARRIPQSIGSVRGSSRSREKGIFGKLRGK